MEWDFTADEKKQLRACLLKRYAGPVMDAVAGLRQNTRQGWRTREFFTTSEGDYCFLDLLLGTARARLLKHGIMPPSAKSPLLMRFVLEMLARVDDGKGDDPEPSYLVQGPMVELAGPMLGRMRDGFRADQRGVYTYSEGHGAMVIAAGFSTADVREHFEFLARTDAESALVIDVAKVLRGIRAKLRELRQPLPDEEQKP